MQIRLRSADGGRAQQVGLDAEHVAVAAGVVQHRLDAHLLLDQDGQRLVAHARRGPRGVGNVDGVHADGLQEARAFEFLGARRCPWGGPSQSW